MRDDDRFDEDAPVDDQFVAALTLLILAIIGAIAWGYFAVTRGFHGPVS